MRYNLALSFPRKQTANTFNKMGKYFIRQAVDGLIISTNDLKNTITFPIILDAEVITEGVIWRDWHGAGSVFEKTVDNAFKTLVYRFGVTELGAEIEVDVTYKSDQDVEIEGIEAEVSPEFIMTKDTNVHVEGNAVVAGIMDSGNLGLYTDYGELQAHYVVNADASVTLYKDQRRLTLENRKLKFTILAESAPVRILCQPDGRNTTFTVVIHADGQNPDTLGAVIYGASDPAHPNYGTKGFISRGIKGTGTTFAVTHGEGSFYGFDNEAFRNILLAMRTAGFEIGPHSILNGDDNRNDAITKLPNFDTYFLSRNWIDHNLSAGARTLGVASLGWDTTEAGYYIMDLLESYGYEYAWSYQDDNATNKNQLHEDQYNFPFHLVYQNPHLVMPISGEPVWLYRNTLEASRHLAIAVAPDCECIIDEWIKQCGVITDHDYIAYPGRDGETFNAGTPYLITAKFDTALAYLQTKIAAEEIWNPTMSQFCDYFRKLLNISVEVGNGRFTVINTGGMVGGCSFLIGAEKAVIPYIGGVAIDYKHVTRGTICWVDIPNGETVITY